MSEETVMLTPDSPAGASDNYGVGDAIVDLVQENVDLDPYAQDVNNTGVQDDSYDSYESDNNADSFDPYELLGVDQQVAYQAPDESPNPVPYDRFREVNERAKQASDQLSRWGDVIQEFERQGFNSAEDVQRAIIAQQQQAQEQAIVDRYRQLEEQELLDPQTSQLQMAAELERFRYQQAMQQVSQYMLDQQKTTALSQYPLAQRNHAAVDSLVQRGIDPVEAARIVHEQVDQLTRALVPELVQRLNAGRTAPTPTSTRQSARPTVANGGQQQAQGGRSSLSQLLGISRNRQSI